MPLPAVNLIVLRSSDLDRAEKFYGQIAIEFVRHTHGKGPEHLAYENDGFVFEIYPAKSSHSTAGVRIGFRVANVDVAVSQLAAAGGEIHKPAADSPWGRRAIIRDPDGHLVEIVAAT